MFKRLYHKLVRLSDKIRKTAHAAKIRASINEFHKNNIFYQANALVFIHLPKTGGSTVAHLLREKKIQCINLNSHNPVSLATSVTHQKYFTFLRDPIERVFSYYQMQLRDRSQPYHYLAKRGMVELLENCWEVRNQATRYYSGIIELEPCEKQYKIAMDNLDQFFFVGNFETFEKDSKKLLKKLGCSVNSVPVINEHPKPKIQSWEVDCIKAFNEFDILLQKRWAKYEN